MQRSLHTPVPALGSDSHTTIITEVIITEVIILSLLEPFSGELDLQSAELGRVTEAGGRISGAQGRTGGLCQQLCELGVTARCHCSASLPHQPCRGAGRSESKEGVRCSY